MRITLLVAVLLVMTMTPATLMAADGARKVGVAAVDITPDYAIRLNGFGHRRS